MVVLISDLLDDPASVVRGLKHFQYRGTDVIVFHVLDPDELDFPFDRATRFEDLETGEEIWRCRSWSGTVHDGDRLAHRPVPTRAGRERHRLSAAQHEAAARAGAALVSLGERQAAVNSRTTCNAETAERAEKMDSLRALRVSALIVIDMLSFLSPLFLVGALAAAVPIVLHLLKRAPEPRVRFGAVQLLRRASIERTEKRSVRELLLLALRVAALGLLALAFARPFFASGSAAGSGSATIVALDTSYSMSAPGRFERAQQLAKDAVTRAAAADLVGVVAFSDEADVAVRAVHRSSRGPAGNRSGAGRIWRDELPGGHRCRGQQPGRPPRRNCRRDGSAGERMGR